MSTLSTSEFSSGTAIRPICQRRTSSTSRSTSSRWRIADPLQYFLRLHDERSAQSRLDDILSSETRNAVAKHELIEIIRTTKDRVPLRDVLVTDAARLDVGSLVPI